MAMPTTTSLSPQKVTGSLLICHISDLLIVWPLVSHSGLPEKGDFTMRNIDTTKTGTALNQVTGHQNWFWVEFDDGTASIHPTWDEAMTAGNFEADAVQ